LTSNSRSRKEYLIATDNISPTNLFLGELEVESEISRQTGSYWTIFQYPHFTHRGIFSRCTSLTVISGV